jgi:MFS superfamily sulfate permease-like transporter
MKNLVAAVRHDLPAAIVVFLVALPLCLGVAVASDAAALNGLIAGIIGGIVVGAISGSHLSVSGPAAGLAAIVSASISELGSYEMFLVSVVIAGVMQLILGLLKAGIVGRYIPNAVIKGMLAAIGILLILKQIPHFVGYDSDPLGEESFFQPDGQNTFSELLLALNHITPMALLISAITSCLLLFYESKWMVNQKWKQFFPGPLAAVIVGVVMNMYLLPEGHLLALRFEHVVDLPIVDSLFTLNFLLPSPDWSAINDEKVWSVAFAIAVVASLESLLSLEAVDKLDKKKRISPPNRELIAQGFGNSISGLLGGLPITSVIVRSSANLNAGAVSKLSAIMHGFLLLLTFLFIPGILNAIPKAALASILILTGYKLTKLSMFREFYNKGMSQFIPFMVTIVAIVFTDMLYGIIIGLLVGLFFILKSNVRSSIIMVKDENRYLIKFGRNVSFLDKAKLVTCLSRVTQKSSLLFDISGIEFLDHDIQDTVNDFVENARQNGIRVYFKESYKQRKRLFNYHDNEIDKSYEEL